MSHQIELPIVGGDNEMVMFLQLLTLREYGHGGYELDQRKHFMVKVRLRHHSKNLKTNNWLCRLHGITDLDGTGELWEITGKLSLNFETWSLQYPVLSGGHPAFRARYNTRTRRGTLFLTVDD